MIKSMDMVHLYGQMEENILDIGLMESKMEKEHTFFLVEQ